MKLNIVSVGERNRIVLLCSFVFLLFSSVSSLHSNAAESTPIPANRKADQPRTPYEYPTNKQPDKPYLNYGTPGKGKPQANRFADDQMSELWIPMYSGNGVARYDFASGTPKGIIPNCNGAVKLTSGLANTMLVACALDKTIREIWEGAGGSGVLISGSSAMDGITLGDDGNLYVANIYLNTITRHNAGSGALLGNVVTTGLNQPYRLAFGTNNDLFVANWNGGTSGFVTRHDRTTGALLNTPVTGLTEVGDIEIRNGELFVLSAAGVQRYNPTTGALLGSFLNGGPALSGPRGFDFGINGILYISDAFNNALLRYDAATGAFIDTFVTLSGFIGDPMLVSVGILPSATPSNMPTATATVRYPLTATPTLDPALLQNQLWVTYPGFGIGRYYIANGNSAGSPAPCDGALDSDIGPDGNIYVICFVTSTVRRYSPDGTDLGQFALVDFSSGVTWHNGFMYVTNYNLNTVTRYDSGGQLVGTFIDQNQHLGQPYRILFGDDGYVYVVNWNAENGFLTRHDPVTGEYIDTVVSNLLHIGDVEWVNNSLLVVSSNGLKRYDPVTHALLGNFSADGPTSFYDPRGIELGSDGKLYVSDGAVYRYDAATGAYLGVFVEGGMFVPGLSGDILYVPRTPRPTPTATSTEQFTRTPTSTRTPTATPTATATVDPSLANHTIWVPNNFANEVLRYSVATGALLSRIPTCGSPFDLALTPDNYVLVACYYTGQIRRYDRNGNYLGVLTTVTSGDGIYPQFGPDGMLYVGIESANRVERYTSAGAFVDVFITGLSGPSHMVFGTDGNIYVANWNGGTDGIVTRHSAATGQLIGTNPVVVGLVQLTDVDWRNGELLTLSVNGVERYNPTTGERLGNFSAGGPELSMPRGMEFGLDTRLYVMDAGNGSIYRYKASGVYLDTFASGSPLGFPGDPLYVLSLGTPTPTATPVPRVDTIGVYKDGVWSLRNSNTDGGPDITAVYGGDASDLPVVGDWDGNGVDTIGVYRGNSGFFYLSDSNTSPTTSYTVLLGNPGDVPFAGKWLTSATHDGIGVYRDSNGILYQKNDLTSGFSDYFAVFGNPGDKVIAGDWNGDGRDSIGVSREADGKWYFSNNSTPNGIIFSDITLLWGLPSMPPIAGDWDGNGLSEVGYNEPSNGMFVLRTALTGDSAFTFVFGPTNGLPVAGKWIAGSQPNLRPILSGRPGDIGNNNVVPIGPGD